MNDENGTGTNRMTAMHHGAKPWCNWCEYLRRIWVHQSNKLAVSMMFMQLNPSNTGVLFCVEVGFIDSIKAGIISSNKNLAKSVRKSLIPGHCWCKATQNVIAGRITCKTVENASKSMLELLFKYTIKICQIRWAMHAKFYECSTDIVPIGRIPSLGCTEVVGNRQRHCRQAHKDSICNPVNCFKRSCYNRKYKLQIKSVNQRRLFRSRTRQYGTASFNRWFWRKKRDDNKDELLLSKEPSCDVEELEAAFIRSTKSNEIWKETFDLSRVSREMMESLDSNILKKVALSARDAFAVSACMLMNNRSSLHAFSHKHFQCMQSPRQLKMTPFSALPPWSWDTSHSASIVRARVKMLINDVKHFDVCSADQRRAGTQQC